MLTRLSLAAVAVLATAVLVTTGAARRAATTQATIFVIRGHGWGHGVGMAQYGALGYARHGLAYQKILAHYYPGTTLARTTVDQVRVLLAARARNVVVSSSAPFRVRDANGKSYKVAPGTYTIGAALKIKVSGDAKAKPLPGPLVFTPGRVPLQLGRPYRGSIQLTSTTGGVQAINLVGLEDYVRGVISQEVSSDWPAEALAAQAVASRSYAVATRKRGDFDVYADTRSQVYGGVNAEQFSTNAAVDATSGKVLSYKGQPAIAYFYASSGGKTAAIQDVFTRSRPVPYLISVSDPYDTLSPYHNWGPYVYSPSLLAKRLGLQGRIVDARAARNPSSRVTSVAVTTVDGQRTFTGSEFRRAVGLRSTWFSVGVLSLVKPTSALVYGVASPLTGVARGLKRVRIEALSSGRWRLVTSVAPTSDGSFEAAVKADAPRLYRLSSGKAATPAVKVPVAPFVRLDAASNLLTGRVRPVVRGATVAIQRYEGTTWTQVATAKLDAKGRFAANLQLIAGTYRARIAPLRGFVAGVSPVLRVVGS
jgi:stage II sporulation protein D